MVHALPRIGAAIAACAIAGTGVAQPQIHAMPEQALMTARATVAQAVPKFTGTSEASATGAFVLGADAKTVQYRMTWDGLSSEAIVRIDVHNFGRGAAGPSVATLCGGTTPKCPARKAGTIEGTWNIDAKMAREMATERMYVEVHIEGARGVELRGQILPLPWMVHSQQFVGRLKNGTATLYVTDFPQGMQLQFDVTVAALPPGETVVEFRHGNARVGALRVDGSAITRRGGTVSGILRSGDRAALLDPGIVAAIQSGATAISVLVDAKVVSTGPLEPVR